MRRLSVEDPWFETPLGRFIDEHVKIVANWVMTVAGVVAALTVAMFTSMLDCPVALWELTSTIHASGLAFLAGLILHAVRFVSLALLPAEEPIFGEERPKMAKVESFVDRFFVWLKIGFFAFIIFGMGVPVWWSFQNSVYIAFRAKADPDVQVCQLPKGWLEEYDRIAIEENRINDTPAGPDWPGNSIYSKRRGLITDFSGLADADPQAEAAPIPEEQ
jgi:hypothetical protein